MCIRDSMNVVCMNNDIFETMSNYLLFMFSIVIGLHKSLITLNIIPLTSEKILHVTICKYNYRDVQIIRLNVHFLKFLYFSPIILN